MDPILGGIVGGLFRMAPEFLKWFDRKDERKHELAMFDRNIKADQLRADLAIKQTETEGQFKLDGAGLEALVAAIKGQSQLTGVEWVDALNASVRPVLAYWLMALYASAKMATFATVVMLGWDDASGSVETAKLIADAVKDAYTTADMDLLSGVFTFFFLDRVIRKQQGR